MDQVFKKRTSGDFRDQVAALELCQNWKNSLMQKTRSQLIYLYMINLVRKRRL